MGSPVANDCPLFDCAIRAAFPFPYPCFSKAWYIASTFVPAGIYPPTVPLYVQAPSPTVRVLYVHPEIRYRTYMPRFEIRLDHKTNQILSDLTAAESQSRATITRRALALFHFCRVRHRNDSVTLISPSGSRLEIDFQ